ncbi:MAG: SUMF1/EgtB/PvdO family nonheme iron enzyme [Chloroflexi bacterium]|nr:SUMF1/EgtB/PvdO family nonheme iron enzyme [Chloroflexota bacterium]
MKIKTSIISIFYIGILFLSGCNLSQPISSNSSNTETSKTTEIIESTELNPTIIIELTITPIPSDTSAPQISATSTSAVLFPQISSIDSMPMLYISAGEFQMGLEGFDSDERPVHSVYIDSYWIDKYEVSITQYKACMNAGACSAPKHTSAWSITDYFTNPIYENYPVVFVDWNQANDYCTWAGRRLPTEAEWEKAARGNDQRLYPWGNREDSVSFANIYIEGGPKVAAPVDSFPNGVSIFGVYNLAGNVWEWVSDFYSDEYYSMSPIDNPAGPVKGIYHVVRGGSYGDLLYDSRVTNRMKADPVVNTDFIGFRCAMNIQN